MRANERLNMGVPEQQNGGNLMRDDTLRHVVVFLVIGAIAGWLASWIVGGSGLLTYLLSGVIGAFVGGYLFTALKINLPIRNIWLSQVVTATVGAIIVVIVARLIASS
jgi:uncharacterized membrane protein YeaQ/YmgE (transglycosylase-associated protein family)